MFKMLVNWYKVKSFELEMKVAFYEKIKTIMDNHDEITNAINIINNLYNELKNVPVDQLRNQFIEKLATIIHEESKKEREHK